MTTPYTVCEQDENGHLKPRFFGLGSLVITEYYPTCL